ncbi:hypothetical protein P692DRAFT_20883163 [Suillus brevipes Sb2]|nr:hypothetical protein P692DRAFT_20883163 [Suillus brevipes Sb2]
MTDIAILPNYRRFRIPAYIVRVAAEQHIRNLRVMADIRYKSDSDEGDEMKDNLDDANMQGQRISIQRIEGGGLA